MPSIESRLEELLRRGEEMRSRGERVSAEDLCRDCPELVMLLRARMDGEPLTKPREDTSPSQPTPARSHENDDLHIGSEPIAGYKLVLRLGRGGYGEVWKAIAPGGFEVALKFVPLATDGIQLEQRALDIIRTLRHPCLLTTVGSWQTNRYLVIAMELADRTLKDRFQEAVRQGYLGIPREELLEYFHEAARGLDFLNDPRHPYDGQERVSFQHRDIKPENILLVGGGAKVADFGLVRLLEQAQTSHTGSMTPIYAAPEFFEGHTSQHSDQYSLAITYCHLRGGRVPFVGSLADVMRGHLEETPDLSMLPPEERPIVTRALAKVPTQRWPNCVTLISELRNCLAKKVGTPVAAAANLSGATYRPPAGSQVTALPPASSYIVKSEPKKRRGLGFAFFTVVAISAVVAVAMNESSRDYVKDLFAEKKSDDEKSEKKKTEDEKQSTAEAEASTKKSTEAVKSPEPMPAAVALADKTPPAIPVAPALPTEPTTPNGTGAEKAMADPPKVNTNPTSAKLEAPALLNPNQEPQGPPKDETAKPAVPSPSAATTVAATGTPSPPITPPAPPTPIPASPPAAAATVTATPPATSPPNPAPTATEAPTQTSPANANPTAPTVPAQVAVPAPNMKEAPLPEPRVVPKPGAPRDPKVVAAVTPVAVAPKEPPPPLKAPFNETAAKSAQQAWAAYAGRPVVETNSIGMELTLIPPGEFSIGMDTTDVTRPPHALSPQKAVLKSPFSMATTEVTQAQWFRVMQTQPWSAHRMKNDDNLPAAWISWTEANQFCAQLTKMEQEKGALGKQARYQLPSEAEWEWSCRAGTTSKFSCSDAELAQYCWYENNSDDGLHPVRKLKPNPFSLFDMHGNAAEWCRDNFLSPASMQLSKGFLRGGNWKRTARHCASAARDPLAIDSQHSENGFRVVRTEQPQ